MTSPIDGKIVPFGQVVDKLHAFLNAAAGDLDTDEGPMPNLRKLANELRGIAADTASGAAYAIEDRIYPGVYSTPPTAKPHSGLPPEDGDRCVILVGGVAYEHLRVGGGWLIPNIDAEGLALPEGATRVGTPDGTVQDALDGRAKKSELASAATLPAFAFTAEEAQRIFDNSLPLTDYAELLAYEGRATGIRLTGVYVTAKPDGRVGVFQYNPAAPNASNGGTRFAHASGVGAWERQFSGDMHSAWFEAVGGGIVDDTAAMQALLDAAAGGSAVIDPGVYRCTAGLLLRGNLSGPGATLNFVGESMGGAANACMYQTAQGDITGLTIDAAGVPNCRAGVWVNADFQQTRPCRYDLTVKNVSNNSNVEPAYGFIVVRLSGSPVLDGDFDIKATVIGVHATANGNVGDAAGAARGIGVSFNGAGCRPQVRIRDCYVEGITSGPSPFGEDADGIGLVQVDHAAVGAGGIFRIENCVVKDSMGRGFKVQAANAVVDGCVVNGQCYESYATFSPNTRITNSKAYNSGATCISVNGVNCVISGFYGDSTSFAPLRIYPAADNTQVSDSTFVYNAAIPTDKTLRACVFAENAVSLSKVVIKNTFGQGTGVRCLGATNLKLSNCDISGVEYGVAFETTSTGTVSIESSSIVAAVDGVFRAGNSALVVNLKGTTVVAGGRGVNLYHSSGNASAIGRISNCTISAGTDGITSGVGSSIKNSRVTSTAAPGTSTGQGISMLNDTEAIGNTVSFFKYNYNYSNTTTAVVMSNVSIQAVTNAYLKNAYTSFAEADNFMR